MFHSPLHSAGYLLDPEFIDCVDVLKQDSIKTDLHTVLERMLPVSSLRVAIQEYRAYKNRQGHWGRAAAIASIEDLASWAYWEEFGIASPTLMAIAMRILAQVI